MKKILSLVVISGFVTLIGCGPSAEEQAAAEKHRTDSIAAVEAQMAADSAAAAQQEQMTRDSMMTVMRNDSIAKAEADAAAKKGAVKPKPKPKPTTTTPPANTPQVGHKKPGAK